MSGLWTFLSTGANWPGDGGIWHRLAQHLGYSVLAMAVAALLAIPLGIVIGHTGRGAGVVAGANLLRALPTLGLLTLLAMVGLDLIPNRWGLFLPSILVLVVLAVPPVLANTVAGYRAADPAAVDAARGIGLSGMQQALRVEFPLAWPLVLAGLRSAWLQVVATASILAVVLTMGGLGRFILDGPTAPANRYGIMSGGAVLVAALAILGDRILALGGGALVSPGLRTTPRRPVRGRRHEISLEAP